MIRRLRGKRHEMEKKIVRIVDIVQLAIFTDAFCLLETVYCLCYFFCFFFFHVLSSTNFVQKYFLCVHTANPHIFLDLVQWKNSYFFSSKG